MGRRFNKKNAQTFSVVHRAHDDALYYDNDASAHVLVPAPSKNKQEQAPPPTKKIYSTEELAQKLAPEEIKAIRENEGLAAQYGIFFDDSKYDYMQHLRPIGQNEDGVFIEANKKEEKKRLGNIEDLFRDQLPSKEKRKMKLDELENIPSQLKGFNPDMDPRLREILEALEDEAYIDENAGEGEGDVFADLLQSGEIDEEDDDFYGSEYDDDYDEWDMDNYEDEYDEKYNSDNYEEQYEEAELPYNEGEAPAELERSDVKLINTNWEDDFNKFKKATKNKVNEWDSDNEEEEEEDIVPDLPTFDQSAKSKKKSNNKLRKKKGALTDTSSFSMSSSALFRSEGLTLLDDRYEQMAKKFEEEEPEEYQHFDMDSERQDLESMLDDFLDNYELEGGGRKLVKKNEDRAKLQEAADAASKGKVAARRKKEREAKDPLAKLGSTFGKLNI